MNSWLLTLLSRKLSEILPGCRIVSCRYLRPIFALELRPPFPCRGPLYLTAFLSRPDQFAFIDTADPLPSHTAAVRLDRCRGANVLSVDHNPTDRSFELTLEGRKGEAMILRIHLFGSLGKVELEEEGSLVASLGSASSASTRGSGRAQRHPFFDAGGAELELAVAGKLRLAGLERPLIECFRKSDGTLDLYGLTSFRDRVNKGQEQFFILPVRGMAEALPAPGTAPTTDTLGPFSDPIEATKEVGRILLARQRKLILSRLAKPLRVLLSRKSRLLERLKLDRERAARYAQVRREAEAMAAYQSLIARGSARVELPDPYDEEKTLVIELDPSSSIEKQIDERFKRASRMERSIPKIEERISIASAEVEEIADALDRIEAAPFEEAHGLISAFSARSGGTIRLGGPRRDRTKTYRSYHLDENWYVLVGRNNKENEELTFREAKPSDYWLHAQDVPGSHVILKSRSARASPPPTILQKAAAVAAYYSRARHSSLVPVLYTERRYVRKLRKAPPGMVTCTRGKTIFAEPRLPEPGLSRRENGEA